MMRISKRCLFLVCSAIGLHGGAALAAPTTYDFSGIYGDFGGVLTGLGIGTIPSGTPFSGAITFDPSATGTTVPYHNGQQTTYSGQPIEITATIDGVTVTASTTAFTVLNNNLNISNPVSYPNGDNLFLFAYTKGNPTWGGVVVDDLYLSLNDSTGAVFAGNSLPTTLALGSFTSTLFGLNYGPVGANVSVTSPNVNVVSPLSTLEAASSPNSIPEPGTAILLLSGAVGLGVLARRQRGVRHV